MENLLNKDSYIKEDVYSDNINWKILLENAINKPYKCQYISEDNNLYENYKKLFKDNV